MSEKQTIHEWKGKECGLPQSERKSVYESNGIGEKDDLSDITEQLRTQDNRATKHPLFCLQILIRDFGFLPEYADYTTWIRTVDGGMEEVPEGTEGAEEVGYRDRWETVMVAFTKKGIHDYMDVNGHNIRDWAHNEEWRIYVESLYRCEEMIRIREALMEGREERIKALLSKALDEMKKLQR
jgi:hypothetical protein